MLLAAWPVVMDASVRLACTVLHAHLRGPWAAYMLATTDTGAYVAAELLVCGAQGKGGWPALADCALATWRDGQGSHCYTSAFTSTAWSVLQALWGIRAMRMFMRVHVCIRICARALACVGGVRLAPMGAGHSNEQVTGSPSRQQAMRA